MEDAPDECSPRALAYLESQPGVNWTITILRLFWTELEASDNSLEIVVTAGQLACSKVETRRKSDGGITYLV
jgi:hypothetical protein